MSTHGSATALEATPKTSSTETLHASELNTSQATISDALRRRAHSVINDYSIDPQWRAIIRYALEINDPWLPELVRRTEAGQSIRETIGLLATADQ